MFRLLFQSIHVAIVAMALFLCTLAQAGPILVTVDTSRLAATSATLAFDLIGDQSNVAVVRQLEGAIVPGS